MPDAIAAANKELVRRFYEEVYGAWNMKLVDDVVSPRFTSHDWPEAACCQVAVDPTHGRLSSYTP